jgi:tetratricopeptide (TPR) repeat protein
MAKSIDWQGSNCMKYYLRDPFIVLCLGGLLWLGVYGIKQLMAQDPTSQLAEASVKYMQGENGSTAVERQTFFNQALEQLLELEKQYSPMSGNGKLYFNIGNSFYQLGEYPFAVLYYERALALRPRDSKVLAHLRDAQAQLEIADDHGDSPLHKVLFFHYYLSGPERMQIFFLLVVAAALCGSLYFWREGVWLYRLSILVSGLAALQLLAMAYSYYATPAEAIVVQSSELYRDAGRQYATVQNKPVAAGLKVRVLGERFRGKWLQVQTPQGSVGFIPGDAVRIIDAAGDF